ncbi:GAF and ANTAR domain-containing protein [Candidatus Gottesmanbacteria bacterium]|nr:GAF and ANTAR domain-containing protein [Candidatus Gottesmanbacteria bacterium]
MRNSNKLSILKKELTFLYRVAQSVHSLELDELLKEIVKIATQVTHGDSCLIYILDKEKQSLILRASKNPHKDLFQRITMKLGEGITGWVAKEKRPVAISQGAAHDPRFKFFRSLPEDKFEAFLSVPIINKVGVVGVINVQHKKMHKHADMEINLLSAIGRLVGGAVENALLIEESMALKEALEIRKLIERAKGILMKRKSISEPEAYRQIQKESMDSRKSLKEIAEAIILADKLQLGR